METRAGRKFSFNDFVDLETFGDPRANQAEAASVYTDTEIAAARAAGYADGRAAALSDTERSAAETGAAAAARIAAGVDTLLTAEAARDQAFRAAAFDVAMAALRKVVPGLARRFGQQEIEAAIAEILGEQMDEPRIVVRVADTAFDRLSDQVDNIASKQGFPGKLVLLAEPTLGSADFKVEWADGGVERVAERTLAEIQNAIARLTRITDTQNSPADKPAA